MPIDATTLVFFGAFCLGAAAGRITGGAGYVLSLCSPDLLRGAVSLPVPVEAERSVRRDLPPPALATYHELLVTADPVVVPIPEVSGPSVCVRIAGEKDRHVAAAAVAVGAPSLLSLAKPLSLALNDADLPTRALSPREFVNEALPHRANAERLRR